MKNFIIKSSVLFVFQLLAGYLGAIKNEALKNFAMKTFDDFQTLIFALLKIDVTSQTATDEFWQIKAEDHISDGLLTDLTAVDNHPSVQKFLNYIDNRTTATKRSL